ncbi:hypothetical protein VC83_08906 [Pseudogymnoascus destructans]|uniref:Uncharacterized protein n=2 Tax=Pseudogymnoascus destructans TaxID=655981 RepID=L8G825_PSED2|nr:uncharacterized protein VC83_08906 [Pseudogymnoascus destructans]ELR08146.1 hypothetical protein GMDG_02968 [Pseudogymnoascus destructans 20631-21]OAF54796.1 hypothetical protein VC83_08906 [Pseudogymnoascus destructans]
MPHIASLGTQPIQWFSQFSFTDPLTRHRVTFTSGNSFTAYGNAVCRFDVGFVHERIPGEAKLFALITELEDCGEDDPVLQLPRMRLMSQSQRIIGLPVIGSKPVYVVDMDMDPTHDQAAAPFQKGPLRLSSTSRDGNVGNSCVKARVGQKRKEHQASPKSFTFHLSTQFK